MTEAVFYRYPMVIECTKRCVMKMYENDTALIV